MFCQIGKALILFFLFLYICTEAIATDTLFVNIIYLINALHTGCSVAALSTLFGKTAVYPFCWSAIFWKSISTFSSVTYPAENSWLIFSHCKIRPFTVMNIFLQKGYTCRLQGIVIRLSF